MALEDGRTVRRFRAPVAADGEKTSARRQGGRRQQLRDLGLGAAMRFRRHSVDLGQRHGAFARCQEVRGISRCSRVWGMGPSSSAHQEGEVDAGGPSQHVVDELFSGRERR